MWGEARGAAAAGMSGVAARVAALAEVWARLLLLYAVARAAAVAGLAGFVAAVAGAADKNMTCSTLEAYKVRRSSLNNLFLTFMIGLVGASLDGGQYGSASDGQYTKPAGRCGCAGAQAAVECRRGVPALGRRSSKSFSPGVAARLPARPHL